MAVLERVRNKLSTKVFSKLGSSLTWEAYSSSSTDKWGDRTVTYSTGVTLTAVPYNLISSRQSFEKFGNLQEGEVDLVVPYTSTIGVNDRITFNGVVYFVKEREEYTVSDGVVAYAVRLAKTL
jgi:hypothetical protein